LSIASATCLWYIPTMPSPRAQRTVRDLFFTLPPAGFFLLLFFKLGEPWNYLFLVLSIVFLVLAARVLIQSRYD